MWDALDMYEVHSTKFPHDVTFILFDMSVVENENKQTKLPVSRRSVTLYFGSFILTTGYTLLIDIEYRNYVPHLHWDSHCAWICLPSRVVWHFVTHILTGIYWPHPFSISCDVTTTWYMRKSDVFHEKCVVKWMNVSWSEYKLKLKL